MSGCETVKPKVLDEVKQVFAPQNGSTETAPQGGFQVPDAVMQDILAGQQNDALAPIEEPHFHVVADEVDLRPFFAGLVADSPYSVIVHPSVTGTISLDLKDVTLLQTIDAIRDMYGYDIRRNGNIWTVKSPGMRTETIAVDYLMMTRSGSSSMTVNTGGVSQNGGSGGSGSSGGNGNNNSNTSNSSNGGGDGLQSGGQSGSSGSNVQNGSNIRSSSQADFWQDLQGSLESLIGQGEGGGRMVTVSPMTGLVTIKALPHEIATVKEYLHLSEQTLTRQVVLEAKIVEVSLNDDSQQGINWQQALGHISSTDFIFNNSSANIENTLSAGLGGVSNIRFSNRDFSGVITLLETQGNVQVLSSPRVTATNNQKAVIKVGQDEYFVTDVSSTTTTGAATTTTPQLELTPFFSGIALDVTPQINKEGDVILHVHPSVTETSEQEKVVTLSDQTIVLPLAQSNIRESDTIIRARSGEIVVIGGLMQTSLSDTSSKTPLLGDIPLLGKAFSQNKMVERKKELVILMKATVVGAGTWQQQLERSDALLKNWYSSQ